MARRKEVAAVIKLQCSAGKATPAPPVGTALGPHGIHIGEFVKQFNDATRDKGEVIIPVEVSIYKDRSFSFVLKSPPASELLKMAAGLDKGAGEPGSEVVGQVTRAQIEEIIKTKEADLNAASLEAAVRIIEGTARSMGIKVEG